MGGRMIAVLDRSDGPPLLVDRGWVPTARAASIATPAGAVTIDGYIRAPDHAGLFTVHDDPAARRFYTLDPAAIGAALGLERTAPFVLVALGPRPPDLFPEPAHAMPRPPNDHLGYAITWYGLAVALLVIFIVYSRKVLRP
jgi:surfeit locus 1 family protein